MLIDASWISHRVILEGIVDFDHVDGFFELPRDPQDNEGLAWPWDRHVSSVAWVSEAVFSRGSRPSRRSSAIVSVVNSCGKFLIRNLSVGPDFLCRSCIRHYVTGEQVRSLF